MNKTMLTDLYQLTMLASYFDNDKNDDNATFELFIRNLPENWGYFIVAGVNEASEYIISCEFTADDMRYLRKQNLFKEEFLTYLKNFKFTGDVFAVAEGTVVAPNTPIMRITGKRMEVQFIESALLNIINYQTMIATKASRIVRAAEGKKVVEFGLRRAQGEDAALKGARAAYIGGVSATSNVLAGKTYGIPISGTCAHSFVMSFNNEIDAFRAYVKTFSKDAILLIDTYDTIIGTKNAIIVAKELEKQGKKLKGVRLDSGDLLLLSREVRRLFDKAKLEYIGIVVSNDLNEYKIAELIKNDAPIDCFGVGTELITAKPVAAISGVYKLVEDNSGYKIKLSKDKVTYPGKKQVYRQLNIVEGKFEYDVLALEDEVHNGIPLLQKVIAHGGILHYFEDSLVEIRDYCKAQVEGLKSKNTLLVNPIHYELVTSEKLNKLMKELSIRR